MPVDYASGATPILDELDLGVPDAHPEPRYDETDLSGLPVFGDMLALDTEGSVDAPWGLSASAHPGTSTVVAAKHAGPLRHPSARYVLHNALHDLPVLRALGVDLPNGSYVDTQVMAYLLRLESQSLKTLAQRLCGMEMTDYEQVVGQWVEKGKRKKKLVWSIEGRTLDDVPRETAVRYAARDADATLRVYHRLAPRIKELGLSRLLEMEMGVVPIIDRMQTVGMLVDLDVIAALRADLVLERAALNEVLAGIAGAPVNTASSIQVGNLLFGALGLTSRKRTKGGRPSTNDKILSALYFRHLALEGPDAPRTITLKAVMDDRECAKMISSFCDPLPRFVLKDGRFHPTLLNTRVETGRLAGKGMNPLAFPKMSKWGKRFRQAFIAADGHRLGSWDESQIELRMLAHISGDTTMRDAFLRGEDLHAKLCHSLYGIEPAKQTSKDRREAKIVNFAIPMGITPRGLLEQFQKNGLLDKTLEDAEEILDTTLNKVYPGVRAFQEESQAEARRQGYVRDMWDRIYYLPNIYSEQEGLRAGAEREAAALKIQGSAQGVMKLAMAECHRITKQLRAEGSYVEPLLQIHDDLLWEYDTALDAPLDCVFGSAMTGCVSLSVPLGVKHESGPNWGTLD